MLTGILVDLVPYGPEFTEKDYTWANGPSTFWGEMGARRVVSRASIQREMEEWLGEEPKSDEAPGFGIRTKDGKPIGDIGLHYVSGHHRLAPLGAVIGEPEYWSGGFGSDALCLVVEYCFRWLDLRRLELSTMSINERAMRNVEKCGFTLEGRGRQAVFADGQYYDEMHYGLLRAEWPGYEVMAERLNLREKAARFYAAKAAPEEPAAAPEPGA